MLEVYKSYSEVCVGNYKENFSNNDILIIAQKYGGITYDPISGLSKSYDMREISNMELVAGEPVDISFILPSLTKWGTSADLEETKNTLFKELVEVGFMYYNIKSISIERGNGCWVSEANQLVEEDNLIINIRCILGDKNKIRLFEQVLIYIMDYLKLKLQQECMATIINNNLYIKY